VRRVLDVRREKRGELDDDSDEGERYVSVVQNPETKLWVAKHIGAREKEDWLATIYDMDSRLDRAYPLPLIVSDNWDPIKDAVEEVYGIEYLPVSHRPGRPYSKGRFAVRPDLKYAQVMKVRDEHGNLKAIETRVVHGDPVDVGASLLLSGSRNISTSSVERQNLSVRNYGKRFARKTICFSKDGEYLVLYTEVLQAWFNFTKLHRSLRVKNQDGSYTHRTPAMAQGLADKRLNWEEILRWRCD
jgi:hypothetical protein